MQEIPKNPGKILKNYIEKFIFSTVVGLHLASLIKKKYFKKEIV